MKHITTAIILTTIFICLQATAGKKKQTPYTYEFPAAMAEPIRQGYTEICNKGQILYNLNCAKCHNIQVGNKELIPDFKQEQLIGYELRVKNAKHESALPEESLTAEELGHIMTFLMYKKKN